MMDKKSLHIPPALIVEDNVMLQKVYKIVLEDMGYLSDVVSTGKGALELLNLHPYALVLIDIGLPDKKGTEVTKIFRQSKKWKFKKTIIVAISAHLDDEAKKNCLAVGCDLVLDKPVYLKNELKEFLSFHEKEEALKKASRNVFKNI